MFWVLPPAKLALQLFLPLPPQVVRCWNIAMPEVAPLVGATMLMVGVPLTLGAPGLPPLLTNTIVTPPDLSLAGQGEFPLLVMVGVVAGGVGPSCGGALITLVEVTCRFDPLLKT